MNFTDTEVNFTKFRGCCTEQFTAGCLKQEITSFIIQSSFYKLAAVSNGFQNQLFVFSLINFQSTQQIQQIIAFH
jgi:hypothetical protein